MLWLPVPVTKGEQGRGRFLTVRLAASRKATGEELGALEFLLEEALSGSKAKEEGGGETSTWLVLQGGRRRSVRIEVSFRLQLVEGEG